MSPRIHTRLASAQDAPSLARLATAFNGSSDPPEQLAQRLQAPARVETLILAEVEAAAAGFAALRVVPCVLYAAPHAELTELYVEPPFRRQGVGRALITHAERLARAAGATGLLVLTDFHNDPAQALYHAAGFVNHDVALMKSLT